MKITRTVNYSEDWLCPLDYCERHYCAEHRLLWRDHDTALGVRDGVGRLFFELRDCPECVRAERIKRIA